MLWGTWVAASSKILSKSTGLMWKHFKTKLMFLGRHFYQNSSDLFRNIVTRGKKVTAFSQSYVWLYSLQQMTLTTCRQNQLISLKMIYNWKKLKTLLHSKIAHHKKFLLLSQCFRTSSACHNAFERLLLVIMFSNVLCLSQCFRKSTAAYSS